MNSTTYFFQSIDKISNDCFGYKIYFATDIQSNHAPTFALKLIRKIHEYFYWTLNLHKGQRPMRIEQKNVIQKNLFVVWQKFMNV